jgi:flagellar biosynthetic protein FliR
MNGGFADMMRTLGLDLAYGTQFLTIALVLCRLVPCVVLAPFLGGKSTPSEVKMCLILVLAIVTYPFARRTLQFPVPEEPLALTAAMLREIFIGMAMGLVASQIYSAVEMAGRIVDTVRGEAMAEVMVPQMEGRATPTGDILYQYSICLIFAIGGHRVYIQSIALSFERFPLLSPIRWNGQGMLNYVDLTMRVGGDVMLIAVGLALPCAAATFIIDVVFGLLNRVAPQLNAYFMAMPVKAVGGLMLVFVSVSMISTRLETLLAQMLQEVDLAIRYLAG